MPPVQPRKSSSASSEDIAAYFYELEQLLTRVEGATTHYQVLGLSRTATTEEIKAGYTRMMRLQPQSHRTFLIMPDIAPRIEVAFRRIAAAFAALSHFGRRTEYDNSLRRRVAGPLPPPELSWTEARLAVDEILSEPLPAPREEKVEVSVEADVVQPIVVPVPEVVILANQAVGDNRRRSPRIAMALPVQVTGYDRVNGRWTEATHTIDTSRLGLSCRLHTAVVPGTVLHMLLPLPVPMRSHGCVEQGFTVYSIVRRVESLGDGLRIVGMEFLGEHAPAGYTDQPWATFGTVWSDPNRRREKREERFEMLEVSYVDEQEQRLGTVIGYTENVSRSGVCLSVETIPVELNLIRVKGVTLPFASRAFVRNRIPSGNTRESLCLQLVDVPFPDR
jgi:hypothetical protein